MTPRSNAALRIATTGLVLWKAARDARAMARRQDQHDLRRQRALLLHDTSCRVLQLHQISLSTNTPPLSGPAILACNHVSWLDPIVVGSVLPLVAISKVDMASWPLMGSLARDLGTIFYARGDRASGMRVLRETLRTLQAGLPVLSFPEGTTTPGTRVLELHDGLFGLAQRARIPIIPLAIGYEPASLAWVGQDSFLPHYWRVAKQTGAQARLRFGALVHPRDDTDAKELSRTVRRRIEAMVAGFKKEPGRDHVAAAGT